MLGEEEFRRYIAAFNRSEFAVLAGYYAPDVRFRGQGGRFESRDEVLAFYRVVKSRLSETIRIKGLIVGENDIAADLETELHALEDWPDFPTGPLKKGETRRSENFVWYEIRERQFTLIRSARYRREWEDPSAYSPGKSDADLSMPPARFAEYIDAFNRGDVAGYSGFYDDDVVLVIAGRTELRGRQAIIDFYGAVKSTTDRTIQVNRVITAPGHLAAELESEFVARQDLPDFAAGPMKEGDRMFINTIVFYDLRAGKFARIRSGRLLNAATADAR